MTYAYQETAEERARVDAALAKMGVSFPGPSATRSSAKVISLDANPTKRQPLGLRPVDDPADDKDDDPANGFKGFHFRNDAHGARPEDALRSDWLFHYLDIIGGVMISLQNDTVKEVNDLWEDVKRKFREAEAAQRTELADLRATVAELRGEIREMKSIQEAARVASRGEEGREGPRGVPGPPGPRGERGAPGERGAAAAMIVAWEPTPERFVLTPILGDGTRGVSAHLLPFFEAYDASVRDEGEE